MCCFSFCRINQQNRMIQPIAVLQGEKSAVKRRCGTGTWRGRDLRIGRTEYVHWAVRQHRSRRSLEPVVFFFVVFVAALCVQQQGSEYVLWTHSGTFHAPLLLSRLRRFVHLVYVTTGSGVDFNMSMNLPIKPQQSCMVSSTSSIDSPLSSSSPLHSFIPDLKRALSANPSHPGLHFLLQDWLRGFRGLFTDTRFLLFSFFSCLSTFLLLVPRGRLSWLMSAFDCMLK